MSGEKFNVSRQNMTFWPTCLGGTAARLIWLEYWKQGPYPLE